MRRLVTRWVGWKLMGWPWEFTYAWSFQGKSPWIYRLGARVMDRGEPCRQQFSGFPCLDTGPHTAHHNKYGDEWVGRWLTLRRTLWE